MEYGAPERYASTKVRVGNWCSRQEQMPLDNPNARLTGTAHYRTFGITNEVYIPKTVTQEQLETGAEKTSALTRRSKKELNFISFFGESHRNDKFSEKFRTYSQFDPAETVKTSYQTDYEYRRPFRSRSMISLDAPDPLMNRIPKNAFEISAASTNKFMDDHFAKVGANRKKVNFFRQMRNSTYIFPNSC